MGNMFSSEPPPRSVSLNYYLSQPPNEFRLPLPLEFRRTPPNLTPPKLTPPKELTDKPWRQAILWTKEFEQGLLTIIKHLSPKEKSNLLMIGPVGSGKSSFIKAIVSIGKGRKYGMAFPGDTGEGSCTLEYDGYTEEGLIKGYHLMDTMGIEPSQYKGFHVEDLKFVIKGHVKKGYKFDPISPISEDNKEYYRQNPTLKDQCHCIIFVVSATAIDAGMHPAYLQKIKQLQEKIRNEHTPQILILTKVDQLCKEVEEDITKIYRSVKVRDAVMTASEVFGIQQACIHPVKNYTADINVQTETNIPLLIALKQAMEFALDRVDHVLRKESEDNENEM